MAYNPSKKIVLNVPLENIHATSDTHWDHKNIIKYSNRPFKDIVSMREGMIENHNNVVGKDDIVLNLGDVAYCEGDILKDIFYALNFKTMYMLRGNHDYDTLYRTVDQFNTEQQRKRIITLPSYYEFKISGYPVIACHYALRVWNKSHHGSWHIYGHSHGSLKQEGKSCDVGVDSSDITGKPELRPFSFVEIKQFMDLQQKHEVDHHQTEK